MSADYEIPVMSLQQEAGELKVVRHFSDGIIFADPSKKKRAP